MWFSDINFFPLIITNYRFLCIYVVRCHFYCRYDFRRFNWGNEIVFTSPGNWVSGARESIIPILGQTMSLNTSQSPRKNMPLLNVSAFSCLSHKSGKINANTFIICNSFNFITVLSRKYVTVSTWHFVKFLRSSKSHGIIIVNDLVYKQHEWLICSSSGCIYLYQLMSILYKYWKHPSIYIASFNRRVELYL